MYFKYLLPLAATVALAQRPSGTSICDYYTTALLKDNTPANQYKLLVLIVNTVGIGNYTQPNVGITVPGILAPGVFNGEKINLLPYFNGCLKSTNVNDVPSSVNFLDGGGAAPLKMNMPANDKNSNQYYLITHLYQFFGKLLGCSGYGSMDFPAYGGDASQYSVHKYMNLNKNQIGYFNTQVGLAAASFGVTQADVAIVAAALDKTFNYRCSPPSAIVSGPVLNSICVNPSCPLDAMAQCNAYPYGGVGMEPAAVSSKECGTAPAPQPYYPPKPSPTPSPSPAPWGNWGGWGKWNHWG